MYSRPPFRELAFRVYLKPTPRTQSESTAILRSLRDLGPISTFQFIYRPPISSSNDSSDREDSAIANVVFSENTIGLTQIRRSNTGHQYMVTANGDHEDPRITDPYNVRGLRSRKPELQPRDFEYEIFYTHQLSERDEDNTSPILEYLDENRYKNTFAVDRSSVFAEILAKSDCPSGLIHGLLPKISNVRQSKGTQLQSIEKQKERFRRTHRKRMLEGYHGQKPGRDIDLMHIDLEKLKAERENNPDTEMDENTVPSTDGTSSPQVSYEFEGLKGFSLMDMYRKAISSDDTHKEQS